MRVLFMGTPELAVPFLEHLLLNKYDVIGVYTRPDRPAGRGRALSISPIKRTALAYGLPVFQPPNFRDPAEVSRLASLKPDVAVITAYGLILPQSVLDAPARGCVNVHFSLLPRFRGPAPVAGVILAGDDYAGVTIMLVTLGVDTGPILARAAIGVSPYDTTGTLTGRLTRVGARFLPDVLARWRAGEIAPRPQDEAQATYTAKLTREAAEIDWQRPAVELWRAVRAYQPWPGAHTAWRGRRLEIIEAVPLPARENISPGRVIGLPAGSPAVVGVGTGVGVLGLVRVLLEGKQAVSAADFLRGQRDFIGAVLPDRRK